MKKLLLLGTLFFQFYFCQAQDMIYTFQGSLTEEKSKYLIAEIESLLFFTEIKLDLKENAGRLFFTIPTDIKGEARNKYTTATIKTILLNLELAPVSCEERK